MRNLPRSAEQMTVWWRAPMLCLIAGFLLIAQAWVSVADTVPATSADQALARVVADIETRYTDIAHVSVADISTDVLEDSEQLLLLDVREADEFAVSHIPGAKRLDPDAWYWDFEARFGQELRGRRIVFYCSVGERSSRMAEHVADVARRAGALSVENLAGGIFAWHNAQLPLSNASGPTDYVHPFDEDWGRLVVRRNMHRLEPIASPSPAGPAGVPDQ